MNTTTTPAEIRAAFDDYTDNGAGCEKFATLTEAASRADVSGDVDEFADNMSEYETSARAFLTMTGATFSAGFLGMFDSLTEWGETENAGAVRGDIPVWRVTISTDGGKMSVRFRGSINDGQNGRKYREQRGKEENAKIMRNFRNRKYKMFISDQLTEKYIPPSPRSKIALKTVLAEKSDGSKIYVRLPLSFVNGEGPDTHTAKKWRTVRRDGKFFVTPIN